MLLELRLRTILVLCAAFLSVSAILADESDIRNQFVLKEGLNYFYNTDYGSADKKFDEYIAIEPDDPVGYWRKALNLFFEAKAEQKTETPKFSDDAAKKLIEFINRGIGRADAKLQKNELIDFHLYVKACLYSIRAIVEFRNVSIWTARGSLMTSISLAEQSQYQDAKYIPGFVNYKAADRVVKAILGLIPHNREKGRRLIFEAAAQNNGIFVDDVWFVVWNIETETRNEKYYSKATVQSLFDYLFAKYPHNRDLQKYLRDNRK